MTPEREDKLRAVAGRRQVDLTVVLENVHDPHNISAVLRSCDAVGISKIFLIYTDPRLHQDPYINLGHRASAGTRKWIKAEVFLDINAAVTELRKNYQYLWGAALGEGAKSMYDLNLVQSAALVFGNEQVGISPRLLQELDGIFIIPQQGLVQSLNISVACAVTIYEAMRQRMAVGLYEDKNQFSPEQLEIFEEYKSIHMGALSYYPDENE